MFAVGNLCLTQLVTVSLGQWPGVMGRISFLRFCAEIALCYRAGYFGQCICGQLQHFTGLQSQCSVFMKLSGPSVRSPSSLPANLQSRHWADCLGLLYRHLFAFSERKRACSLSFFFSSSSVFFFWLDKIPDYCHQTYLQSGAVRTHLSSGRRRRKGDLPRKRI